MASSRLLPGGRIRVETLIRAPFDDVWRHTQEPALHERWDARFTRIRYLPRASLEAPQRFEYSRRVLPGLTISGTGETVGERHRWDGTATSALLFASSHPLSPIVRGSGFWQYVPTPDGIRFITEYDYEPRWGRVGRALDRAVLRPVMAWLTARSFDRLRCWLEIGVEP
ncbi:MAG TPA: SRPBCC family protein [Candidatus Limnocylindrales bacterium]|nr:SRPBCC family protein [Candidatus Limnocylindrales bacterium]